MYIFGTISGEVFFFLERVRMPRNLPVKGVYNRAYSQMIESFGVLMTERVLKILKHFYRVPMIQSTMYIIKIL